MENTKENKAKFFAQYWGQKVKRFYDANFTQKVLTHIKEM